MSYLSTSLRLHFAGQFQATVSTVNNDPTHFDNAAFIPAYQQPQSGNALNGWWNPDGDGVWRLLGCRVTSAYYRDGTRVPTSDPVLQDIVADSDVQAPAKIVDLDPEQQLVSTVWGLQVRIADGNGRTLLVGDMDPAPFTDIWSRIQGPSSAGGDANAGAMFQSVIRHLEWGDVSSSTFLAQLKEAALTGLLSIKFNVDRFSLDSSGNNFCRGRITGTIGVATETEPVHFTLGRQFLAYFKAATSFPAPAGGINNCTAVLDATASVVRLDLGNGLPSTYSGSQLWNIGQLTLRYLSPPNPRTGVQSWVTLGPISYLRPGWYEETAAVLEVPVPPEATVTNPNGPGTISLLAWLAQTPLSIFAASSSPSPINNTATVITEQLAIAEASTGQHVRADNFVYRMSPDDVQTVNLYATEFGAPLVDVPIVSFYDPSGLQPSSGTDLPPPPVDTPRSALTFPSRVLTDGNGLAALTLSASDPANPRSYIDGQVYGVRYALESTLGGGGVNYGSAYPFVPSDFVSVLVYNAFHPDEPVTWYGSLQPIFTQYGNLYPVMARFVDLGNYDQVANYTGLLRLAFSLPEADANSMPVTRDLSPAKRAAILAWLNQPGPDGKPLKGTPPAEAPAAPTVAAAHQAPAAARLAATPPESAEADGPPPIPKGGKAAAFANRLAVRPRR